MDLPLASDETGLRLVSINNLAVNVIVPIDNSESVLKRKYLSSLIAPNVWERRDPEPPDDVGELPVFDVLI